MAFPLSSATLSHKFSFNVSIPSFTSKQSFLSTHLPIQLTSPRPLRPIFSKNPILEFTDRLDVPTMACIPTQDHGLRKVESIIAAILIFVQISSPLPIVAWDSMSISPAKAVLYSPDTKVPRTGELALRKAIPANTNMKAIQDSLEEISYLLRIPQRKPYGTMEGNVKKSLKIAMDEKESILATLPPDLKEKGSTLYASLIDGKGGLQALLQCVKDKDPDKVSVGLASSLDTVAELELLQAPGLSFLLPEQYLKYPRCTLRKWLHRYFPFSSVFSKTTVNTSPLNILSLLSFRLFYKKHGSILKISDAKTPQSNPRFRQPNPNKMLNTPRER
uniref:Peptidyl-prolyl cis-trans isomerase CYP38-like PsbQ-like domain-containing protein n=1 Tax=Vitis vinifera TaxID=29760 RepID=F6H280_VITVI